MTRDIIELAEGYPFDVNTFWMGNKEGVQITWSEPEKGYLQMDRARAIEVFRDIIVKLEEQVEKDAVNPPWWHKNI